MTIFNDIDKYTVIVESGNNEDLCKFRWPSNFLVYETVNQLKTLARTNIFITHCGGNSFNEAIEYNVPMIGIPFFGDQHLIGSKINNLGLGVAFLHDNSDQYIDIENNTYTRQSLTEVTLRSALENIELNHESFVNRIKDIKTFPVPIDMVIMSYYNYPLLWKNGDLLYGSNKDRVSLIKYLKADSEFRLCKYIPYSLPYSKLFYDKSDANMLPRIIEMYNDAFLDANCYPIESSSRFTKYSNNLREYKTWLLEQEYITNLDIGIDNRKEVIWNICLGGIEFFTQVKGYRIHFVFENYSAINKATTLELKYILNNWERLRSKVSFYHLDTKYGHFAQIPITHKYMENVLRIIEDV